MTKVKVFQGPMACEGTVAKQVNTWAAKTGATILSTSASTRLTYMGTFLTLTVTYEDNYAAAPKPTLAQNLEASAAAMRARTEAERKKVEAMTAEEQAAYKIKKDEENTNASIIAGVSILTAGSIFWWLCVQLNK